MDLINIHDIGSYEVFVLGLVFMGLAVSSSCGTGGGSITIPLLIILLKFKPIYAIPLGNIAVLGSTTLNLLFNISKHHPSIVSRPLIDWNAISMMEPAAMLGTLLGAYFHRSMPEHILVVLLMMLLTITAIRMLGKGGFELYRDYVHRHCEEIPSTSYEIVSSHDIDFSSHQEPYQGNGIQIAAAKTPVTILKSTPSAARMNRSTSKLTRVLSRSFEVELDHYESTPVQQHSSWNLDHVPWSTVGILSLLFIGTCSINVVKGIYANSMSSYLVNLILPVYILAVGLWLRYRVLRVSNSARDQSDIEWSLRNSLLYPFLCIFAGIAAGSFGIGGGTIKTPLMLEMGMNPHIVSATSTAMIFFTSMTAASSYFVDGTLLRHYATVLFLVGILSNIFAQKILTPLLVTYGNASILTILVGILVAVSAALMMLEAQSRE
jgi:uncharacterized membrane protein YfcA